MSRIIVEEIDLNNPRPAMEQDLIDLGEQFKEIMKQKDDEINRYKKHIRIQKELIYKSYGIICFVDFMLKSVELPDVLMPIENAFEYLNSMFDIYMD